MARQGAPGAAEDFVVTDPLWTGGDEVTADRLVRTLPAAMDGRFRRLFDESPVPLWVIHGRTLRFLAVNETACRQYLYSREQFTRMTLQEVHPRRQKVIPISRFRSKDLTDFSGPAQHIRADGSIMDVEVLVHRVQFLPIPAWLVVIHDVTAKREAEQLRVRLVAAEKSARLKDLMVNAVSHELRSPLASMRGTLSTLLRYWDRLSRDEMKELVTAADAAARNMEDLVDDLLMLSRFEAGTLVLNRTRFDLASLVAERIRQHQRALPGRAFHLNAGKECQVEADLQKLSLVLGNVLDNAEKYSPADRPIQVSVDQGPRGTSVSVHDQGPGVETDELELIFEPFYRTRKAVGSKAPGAGLGLAISRAIVVAHGGTLQARNNGDGGLTVTLTLPVNQ